MIVGTYGTYRRVLLPSVLCIWCALSTGLYRSACRMHGYKAISIAGAIIILHATADHCRRRIIAAFELDVTM